MRSKKKRARSGPHSSAFAARIIAAMLAIVGGVASLIVATIWGGSAVWAGAISGSLVAYFAYIVQRDLELERKLDAVCESIEVIEGSSDYWEALLNASTDVERKFWSTLSIALDGDLEMSKCKPWIAENAAKRGDVAVPKRLAYRMMRTMLGLLEEGEQYFATVSVNELKDPDSATFFSHDFLSELRNRGVIIQRVLLIYHDDVRRLDKPVLENVQKQIEGGVKFFCFGQRMLTEERNFGLYGERCLGEMVGGWNTFRFSKENVDRGRGWWEYIRRSGIQPLDLNEIQSEAKKADEKTPYENVP